MSLIQPEPTITENHFHDNHIGKYKHRLSLSVSKKIDEDIWSLLEYHGMIADHPNIHSVSLLEVQNTLDPQFLGRSKDVRCKNKKKLVHKYKSFIRQAKHYYDSASYIDHRSSALLYYYSFLNLVKAGLVCKYVIDSRYHFVNDRKTSHGLSYDTSGLFKGFGREAIRVNGMGKLMPTRTGRTKLEIFPLFYQHYYNLNNEVKIPSNLKIKDMFAYISDVSLEYIRCGYTPKILPCTYKLATTNYWDNKIPNQSGGRITIDSYVNLKGSKEELCKYPKTYKEFLRHYKRTPTRQSPIHGINSIREQYEQKHTTTTPSLKPSALSNIDRESKDIMRSYLDSSIQSNHFSGSPDFYISLPYAQNNQAPFCETIAIYAIMFYLSSLLRYSPDKLDELFTGREGLIVTGFIRNAPLTFLRGILSWVYETNYIVNLR